MRILQYKRLVLPILLTCVSACAPRGISPTLTDTPAPRATATEVAPARSPDAILHNGIILTMNDRQPQAQAMAVDGERILAVGTDDEILALRGSSTQVIDLQGMTVTPGFIDNHSHRMTQASKWGFSTLEEAVAEALSDGWTALDELAVDQSQLQELIALDARGGLRLRVNVYLMVNTFEGRPLGDWFRAYQPGQQISPHLRIAGLKTFIDYDSGRTLLFQQDELNELMRQLQSEGWTISVKAISIQSHELALNAFEYVLDGESNDLHRHRIEHSVAASDEQIARMARLGILVCIQPSLPGVASFDPDTYRMRDENGADTVYRWSDYLEGGVFMLASPLNPYADVEEHLSPTHISPMGLLYRSVTQIGVGDQRPLEWMLEKALSVEEILPLLTINGAYATFDEDVRGSLSPSKYADLVILSGNPLDTTVEGLLGIRTMMTMVGGKVEYCAEGQEALCPGVQAAARGPSVGMESPVAFPFTGTWQGNDPFDGSIIVLALVQTDSDLKGTYTDTYSPNVEPPGYEGSGAGKMLSITTGEMTFQLARWDGKTAQAEYSLTLSHQNNTLTLGCAVGCPIVLQRQ